MACVAQWNQIKTEFAGDETTNFGPRQETGTALYQVDTVATIATSDQAAVKVKNLKSAALGELVCVGVDHHLNIFSESQHVTTIAFESLVEAFAWSPDGSLLVVGDSGGKLHLFNAESLHSIISFNLLPARNSDGRAFLKIAFKSDEELKTCDLVLLSATGILFVVKGFSLSAFSDGGDNVASVVGEQLQFRQTRTRDVHTVTTWDAVPLGSGMVLTLGGGDSVMAVWGWRDDGIVLQDSVSDVFDNGRAIVKAKLTSNNKFLFTLDQMNEMYVWLVPELVVVSRVSLQGVGSDDLIDFLLLETQGPQSHSLAGVCVVVLVRDVLSSRLHILSMKSGEDVYTLELDAHTALTTCPTIQESLYVSEGTSVLGDANKVSTVRLRSLTETDPETRLKRILHKKRFEEALQFARLFQLDTEMVYMAQMNQLLDQLSAWNVVCYDDNQVQDKLSQLWTSVQHVKDCQLVAENCMRAALPSFSHTWKLLQLCEHKLSSVPAKTEKHQALVAKVSDLQERLMTFKLAYGAEAYSASSWSAFQQANLLHLVCREMSHHPPDMALLVWKRHCADWGDQMSVEIVQQFLSEVAERLPPDGVTEWLKNDLLPYLARFQPKAMGEVVQWAVHKATNMQELDQRGWPQNAITFLETIDGCVKEITEVNFTTTDTAINTAINTAAKTPIDVFGVLGPLSSTLSMLYQLQDLLQYNLPLSIAQFQQETKETLAFRMLDQVVMVELMKPTLEKYITPYITANNLHRDHIFATYIKDLLERVGHVRSYSGHSVWEDKVLAIVSFILNPMEKCCAVLNVIKHAPLPWSPEIGQLVEEGFQIQHPLVEKLREAKKIVDVRQLMQEYGLKTSIVPDQDQAEKLAIYIAEQKTEKCLEDALRVLEEYNISTRKLVSRVYFRHVNVLINAGKVDNYLQLLHGWERGTAVCVGEKVLIMASVTLDLNLPQPQLAQKINEEKWNYARAAILTCQHLLRLVTDTVERADLNSQLKVYSSLLKLQKEYEISLSVSEYRDEVKRSTVFANFTQRFLRENKPFKASGDLASLYRLADLLKLHRETVQGELTVLEAGAGNWSAVLFLCRELQKAEASKEVGKVLHRVVSALLQLQGQSSSNDEADDSTNQELRHLPVVLEQLANQALCMCDADMIMPCLELSKAARLWKQVGSQCEASDSVFPLWDMEERKPVSDPIQINFLDEVNMDEGLVMNSAIALPLAATSLATLPSIALDDDDEDEESQQTAAAAPVEKAIGSLQPLISHLQDNSHHQLALQFFIVTSAALRESVLKQDMGFPLSNEVSVRLEAQRSILLESEKRGRLLFHSLLSALLRKVLNAHRVDHKMALGYLLSAPRKVSIDCLTKSIASCNFNFRKLQAIASVGQMLGQLLGESKLVSTCQDLQTNAAWGVRLSKLKISFKEAFQGGVTAKHEVIGAMARNEHTDVNLVASFSQDFKLEVENSLLVYLEELLKQSPSGHQLGRAKAVVAAVEAQDRSDFLLTKLKALYRNANAYDYEVLEFLLEELNRLEAGPIYTKGLKLMGCLKMYTRRHPPSPTELSPVSAPSMEECGDVGEALPKWSKQRLPFHPLLEGETWRVITPELDVESIPQWKPIAVLLELSVDELYMIAVQNIVRRHVAHTTSAPTSRDMGSVRGQEKGKRVSLHSWHVSESSREMLQQAQLLLNCVKNCEMALACANWVVRELPMGGDKILALQGCVAFSQRWYTDCEEHSPQKEKARVAMSKFQKVLCKLLTEQTLRLNQLTDPDLLQLVTSPHDLITQLTQHPTVLSPSQQGPVPDVYGTIEKVCEVNGLDVGEVLVTNITKWLLASDSLMDADTTMNLSFSNLKMTEEALKDDHDDITQRVLYFLRRGPRPHMLKFMSDTVLTGEGECTSHLGRMRCLYCLLQIATEDDLQLLGLSCHAIREMLHLSHYLTQLEELHIHHSMQTLRDCNKTGLVQAIWRNHKHQKSAVTLTGNLCLDYKLYDHAQWTAVLQQMISLNMMTELCYMLQCLCSVPTLRNLPVFVSAWQFILLSPLTKASPPLPDDQMKSCLASFNLLQSCRVFSKLDVNGLVQHYERLQLNICAAACLIMDPSTLPILLQERLMQDARGLIEESYTSTALGLNLLSATQVREEVFKHVVKEGSYHLIPPSALNDFSHFIVRQDDIDGCLLFAITNNMVSQAESLMELYFHNYPHRYDELLVWCASSGYEMDSSLQAYLHMKRLTWKER